MKKKNLPRLWCALQGLLPLQPVAREPLGPARPVRIARGSFVREIEVRVRGKFGPR